MTAREWLSSYMLIQEEIEARQAAILDIRERACAVTSRPDAIFTGGREAHKFDSSLAAVEEQTRRLDELFRAQAEIRAAIDGLSDPRHRAVLTYLYICGYSVNAVARRMHYERHGIARLRKQALAKISVPVGKDVPPCSIGL